jgi:glycosyltransferase involved in cell wall biosynthesis
VSAPLVTLLISDSNHSSYLECVVDCLKALNCRIAVMVLVDPDDSLEQFQVPGVELFLHSLQGKPDFSRLLPVMAESQLVILDEPLTLKLLIAYARIIPRLRVPFVLTIHNLHSWFFPGPAKGLKGWLRQRLRAYLRGRAKNLAVIASNVADYARSRLPERNVIYLPFRAPDPTVHPPRTLLADGKLHVVVPGTITRKRNYDDLMRNVLSRPELKGRVSFSLLGKPLDEYGHAVLARCRELVRQGFSIQTFDEYVPREAFHAALAEADLLLSVFDPRYVTTDGQEEVYGQSKETGISFLALAFAKPLVLPEDYVPLRETLGQIVTYRAPADIPALLLDLAAEPERIEALEAAARANLARFDLSPSIAALRGLFRP